MANVNHSTLTDPYLHEPKGVASANANEVYVANGSGSGSWKPHHHFVGAYLAFDATTPAYTHAATTTPTVINPALSTSVVDGFTVANTPNARIVYTDTININAQITITLSTKQGSGGDRDVEWLIYKNGVAIPGAHTIRTISTGDWGSISVTGFVALAPSDYIEVYSKKSADGNVLYASAFWSIVGAPA